MSLVIDADATKRARRGQGRQLIPFDHSNVVSGAVGTLAMQAQSGIQGVSSPLRVDADMVARCDAFDAIRRHQDLRYLQEHLAPYGTRQDDLSSIGASALYRSLEHVYAEVLGEARRPLNWSKLFIPDTRVPPGARYHTVVRRTGAGRAAVYRAGVKIPISSSALGDQRFPVIHIVSGVGMDFFTAQSMDLAGISKFQDESEMSVRAIDEVTNDIFFLGDEPSQLWGVLNYPDLATSVASLSFTRTSMGGNPDGIRAELDNAANYPVTASGATFAPNRVVTSPRVALNLRQVKNGTGGTDATISSFWLGAHPEFTRNEIEMAQELEGIGPNGEDGVLMYNDMRSSVTCVVVQPTFALPMHATGPITQQVVYVQSIGGTVQRDVGHQYLLLVQAQ